jgi:hypothetical protein
MLSAELPIIIDQQQSYGFDQNLGSQCVFPPAANPTCVNASNSTTISDGIVPAGGYDAANRGAGFTDGTSVFRGALRGAQGGGSAGDAFDTFNLGLSWAPMSQMRDPTKPTWVWLVEGQFSIGNVMKFDRANPDANHGVSDGTHRLFIRTALSKRYKYFEPYWGLWYLLPISRGSDSLYIDYGPQQKVVNPQMQGGTVFGTTVIPIDRPDKQWQLAFDLRLRVEGHFQGRGYSELWELLASSPVHACDASQAMYNPACGTTVTNPYQNQPFTGLTTIEGYGTIGADFAIQAQLGPYARFRTGLYYQHDESHFITGDDIGTPQNGTGRVSAPNEFNPAYRPVTDLPGRRYRIDDVNVFTFHISGQVRF